MALRQCDGLDLDEGAGWKLGDLDGRAGGRLVAHVLLVHLVHRREVVEALEEDGRLHEPVETGARRREDRTQVRQHLLGLVGDVVPDDLSVVWLQCELAGHEHEPVRLDRLRVRRTLKRGGSHLGADDLLHASSLLRGRSACASAAPRALKIASSTCCESLPSTRRTCSVRPAVCTSSSRKRAARSPARPAMRACERSTFETSSGRADVSSVTCASASSTGSTAEPWPRMPSALSGSASASPSERAAAVISTSGSPGSTSSARSNDAYCASSISRWSSTGTPVATFVSPFPFVFTRALARPCPVAAMPRDPSSRCARSARRRRGDARRFARSPCRSGRRRRSSTSPRRRGSRAA